MIHIFRIPGAQSEGKVLQLTRDTIPSIVSVQTESCFNVGVATGKSLSAKEHSKLLWLFTETFEPKNISEKSFLAAPSSNNSAIVEVGPRLAFSTAWSSNCVSMCQACGITSVDRIERSRRYVISTEASVSITKEITAAFAALVHDRMTECVFNESLMSFANGVAPVPVEIVPVMTKGRSALQEINKKMGLGFDDWDLDFYTKMFQEQLKRNPTDVECFDLGQSNSEHSRHWFFGGKMIIDGEEKKETLFSMVKSTLPAVSNSVIAFHDNSSSLEGFEVPRLTPLDVTGPSPMGVRSQTLHPILTAETHNFPTGVAPFSGAETGTGGRLRDVMATGRGAHSCAGISAYCVGNLNMPENVLPWETPNQEYASNLATPAVIMVDASNGASDYGNKYGEPVVCGFARSFGQRLPNKERVEWIKPIMFTAGLGWLDSRHTSKGSPEDGMIVCKIGGPAYRIGMGGGAASSRCSADEEADALLDFNAVQRGDAEMENRMNRVIRACIEMGENNPIVSIHDQGAGGNGNVLKEIVDPKGARFELRSIPVGDPTLSALEIWGAEYQENNAFLVSPEHLPLVVAMGQRENCPVSPVGTVTGDGRVVVVDRDGSIPFDLPLSMVLGKMPQKVYTFTTPASTLVPLTLPQDVTVLQVLDRVLRLLDVGSKRFLTNKVDRSVTGLIAQQQCVGPLHTPLSNVAVIASSHFGITGLATAVGEQPVKGLLNNKAQARMTVGEALTNLMWAKVTSISDIKASGNWMWAAKMEGEGAKMWEACEALRDALLVLGPGIDGGKDSLSMAAKVGPEIVKSPGQVTLTCYASCPDITLTVTPDFKHGGASQLLYIDLGSGKNRTGGSALSTVYSQIGSESPDCEGTQLTDLRNCFECVQTLLTEGVISAGHDRSDGGLLVTLLEMAFAGNTGFSVSLPKATHTCPSAHNSENDDLIGMLFSEELGIILEVLPANVSRVTEAFTALKLSCIAIGTTTADKEVNVVVGGVNVLSHSMVSLRDVWENTSFALEGRQCDSACVVQERSGLMTRNGPTYKITHSVSPTPATNDGGKHRVAVIRQEGSNGDREMLASFHAAGLEAWDVNMRDLLDGKVTLDIFRGIVFCGGFSYADVNDSAKGWAGVILFNESLLKQFTEFRERTDTFTLGVCNGCQLMALLGWTPFPDRAKSALPSDQQPRFVHNASGRFESRWVSVQIQESAAVLFKGMQGSTMGVWVAHGEGRALFPNSSHLDEVVSKHLAPLRYVDDSCSVTQTYPMNPNGSPLGIAALCSEDGRHLAMMPHPERCVRTWQWPYMPSEMRELYGNASNEFTAPWLQMFQNAKTFCDSVPGAGPACLTEKRSRE